MREFPRARSGQPLAIRADAWNAAMDAAEWHRALRMNFGGDGGQSGTGYQVLQVLNQSGADVPLFGVMGIGGPANFDANYPDRFQFGPLLQSTTAPPAAATDSGRFCIALEPIASGLIGRALFSGVCPCRVYRRSTDTTPPACADVADGQSGYLSPSSAGARVLWCDGPLSSDGPVWAMVRIGGAAPAAAIAAFELYDDVTPGSTDKYVWTLNSDYSRNTSAGHTSVQVSDQVLGDVRAYGSSHTGWSTTRGALGFYAAGTDGKNQIVAIRRLAKAIKVTAPSNVAASAAFSVSSCTVLDDGQNPCSEGATITITNWPQQLCSGSVAKCYANGSGGWDVWDADCPPSGGCT